MPYALKPLNYDPAALNGLSGQLIISHWENNYGGAVKRLNAIEQRLAELDWSTAAVFEINGLKREEMIASGSMILHEVYFESLGGAGGDPAGPLKAAIERDFGSLEAWRVQFTAMANRPGRRIRLDHSGMESAARPAGQRLGRRSCPQSGGSDTADRPRQV